MAVDTDVGGVAGSIAPAGPDLRMAIAAKADHVIIALSASVTWVALSPDEATTVATTLLQKASDVRNGRGR